MPSTTNEIINWSKTLPYWQQYALECILQDIPRSNEFFDLVFDFFQEDTNLKSQESERPKLRSSELFDFSPRTLPKLKSVSNVRNVNQLVHSQTLEIAEALTIVYGGNGSGKSGYARILANAGFGRGSKELLSDAVAADKSNDEMFADFSFTDSSVTHRLGRPLEKMAGYFVFDSNSIGNHLSKANSISFSPAGLACLKELVLVTEEIGRRVNTKILETRLPKVTFTFSPGNSSAADKARALNANTNLIELEALSKLSELELERLEKIEIEIAQLVIENTAEKITRMDSVIQDLTRLIADLKKLDFLCGESQLDQTNHVITNHLANLVAANTLSLSQFQNSQLAIIGTPSWDRFVKHSHELALLQSTTERAYPSSGDVCLLCHQPLGEKAQDLLLKTWRYAEGETQKTLSQSTEQIAELKKQLSSHTPHYGTERVFYEYCSTQCPQLLEKLKDYLDSTVGYLARMYSSLETLCISPREESITSCHSEFELLIERLKFEKEELLRLDVSGKLLKLRKEQTELSHRVEINKHIDEVKKFVEAEKLCAAFHNKLPKTTAITQKHNQLFDDIVTANYLGIFKDFINRFLHRSVKVSLRTSGAKGEALRQVIFEDQPKAKLNFLKILSEGEQRAVAFADFLTEVTLNDDCLGIILDDPVTSFALEWRESAAKVIVELAKKKQVLVFTHDLAFLYNLNNFCEREAVKASNHWISRGETDGKPGYIYLNNSPACENDYRDARHAREWYKKAKDSMLQERQHYLKQGYTALRTSYEVMVIDSLLKNSIKRFEERVSVESLKSVNWVQSLVDELLKNYSDLCRTMEGHSHSDALNSGQLLLQDFLQAIEKFDSLRKQIKTGKVLSATNASAVDAIESNSQPLSAATPEKSDSDGLN